MNQVSNQQHRSKNIGATIERIGIGMYFYRLGLDGDEHRIYIVMHISMATNNVTTTQRPAAAVVPTGTLGDPTR